VLHPNSEHAEDDGGKEGEGYDGSKHVEPCPQFHRCLLCRTNPALTQSHPAPKPESKSFVPARPTNFDAASQQFHDKIASFLRAAPAGAQ
jgi:hypothetical protein